VECQGICKPFVIGDAKILERANGMAKTNLQVRSVQTVSEAYFQHGAVDCLDLDLLHADLPVGKVSAQAGDAAFRFLAKAVELAKAGEIDAIYKEALQKGGHLYPEHTLSAPRLKVIHVTTHVGLLDAVKMINPERVYKVK
jgi:4-hydroxythreonine-4-phosphate dehydrogenase